jgi:hypothetical protein
MLHSRMIYWIFLYVMILCCILVMRHQYVSLCFTALTYSDRVSLFFVIFIFRLINQLPSVTRRYLMSTLRPITRYQYGKKPELSRSVGRAQFARRQCFVERIIIWICMPAGCMFFVISQSCSLYNRNTDVNAVAATAVQLFISLH